MQQSFLPLRLTLCMSISDVEKPSTAPGGVVWQVMAPPLWLAGRLRADRA
jgi:hypothetical protein